MSKVDIYQQVTDSLVRLIEAGANGGRVRWKAEGASFPLRANGQAYQGINVFLLWSRQQECGFESPYWMTFRQAQELGGCVRKGEKGTFSVFYGKIDSDDEGDSEEGEKSGSRSFRYLKQFYVFNASQIDGLPEKFYPKQTAQHSEPRIAEIEAFVAATGADIRYGGTQAFYDRGQDFIQLPRFEAFTNAALFHATQTHELAHWTKGPGRLERNFGAVTFGDEGYAKEELVAEMTSAFLGTIFNLPVDHYSDHAAYLASWIKLIKDDKKFIMVAAAKAQQAANYLLSFSESKLEQAA